MIMLTTPNTVIFFGLQCYTTEEKDRSVCEFRYAVLFYLHWMNLIYLFTNLLTALHHDLPFYLTSLNLFMNYTLILYFPFSQSNDEHWTFA